jgi:hypothetical protein
METTAAAATTAMATYDANISKGSNGDDRSVSSSEQSSFKRLKTCEAALFSSVAKETTPTLEDIPSELFIQYILPFVGRRQYRFVAAVNRNFHTAYVTAFPEKVTHYNVSTIEHAKIYYDDIMDHSSLQNILCCTAARDGNLTVLKYLRSIQCSRDARTCANAAKNGHLDIIQWCRENGCPWDAKTCENTAKNGHLNVVIWCHQNGCPWDENTCASAAENGHLDVIQWCRRNGCPWDIRTCEYAAANGDIDVFKWCRQNGCPWDGRTCEALESAGYDDRMEFLKWMQMHGM